MSSHKAQAPNPGDLCYFFLKFGNVAWASAYMFWIPALVSPTTATFCGFGPDIRGDPISSTTTKSTFEEDFGTLDARIKKSLNAGSHYCVTPGNFCTLVMKKITTGSQVTLVSGLAVDDMSACPWLRTAFRRFDLAVSTTTYYPCPLAFYIRRHYCFA